MRQSTLWDRLIAWFQRRHNIAAAFDCDVLVFSRAKLGESPETNADQASWNRHARRLAVADGVSKSHLPGHWARLIVEHVATVGLNLGVGEIAVLAQQLPETQESDQWFMEAARSRGSHTTLIAAEWDAFLIGRMLELRLVGIGDSCALRLSPDAPPLMWPVADPEGFTSRPGSLSSTNPESTLEIKMVTWSLQPNDTLILATDAVAKYMAQSLKRNPSLRLDDLCPFLAADNSDEAFQQWADETRMSGLIDDDDLTIAVASFRSSTAALI